MSTRGIVWIHSTPSALCPHVEWALSGLLGVPTRLDWASQPVERGSYRAELTWLHHPGTAAAIASALTRWGRLRFEVSEEASAANDGQRFSYTPGLGLFHAEIGAHGDIKVNEHRLRAALAQGDQGLSLRLDALLGTAWDEELEVFRHAGEGAPIRWLHQVG